MNPLLAADPGTYITLIFVIIGFLGWIMNLTSNKNAPPPAAPARPRPPQPRAQARDERIQSEIDIFLQEVGGRKPARRAEPRERIVEEPPEPPARRLVERPAPQPTPEPVRTTTLRREAVAKAEHRVGSGDLGTTVREHVARYMETARIDQSVKQHLSTVIDRAVQQHLGSLGQEQAAQLAAAVDVAAKAPEGTHPIVGLLRDPKGLRNAVLISEVLGPPRGRRL